MNSVAILGGLGRVGLPLGLTLAEAGFRISAIDSSAERLHDVRRGKMPFLEDGADPLLEKHLGRQFRTYDAGLSEASLAVRESDTIIVTLGTPLDEYGNPRHGVIPRVLLSYGSALDGKLVILRSTVSPGGTAMLDRELLRANIRCDLAFCPERILQGHAISELKTLPQIVSGVTKSAEDKAAGLFASLGVGVERCSVAVAELAKLCLNSWRYVAFAVPNEFLRIAEALGVDYLEVERAMKAGYSRADALPKPGFAAGPCLLKDTMQLVAASPYGFQLGLAARHVNERMPETIVKRLQDLHGPLDGATIGILGMAFKADNDDTRDSLSFQLKKRLEFLGAKVLCSDEHARGFDWVTKEELLEKCSGVVVAIPHAAYRGLRIPNGKVCVDCWGVTERAA